MVNNQPIQTCHFREHIGRIYRLKFDNLIIGIIIGAVFQLATKAIRLILIVQFMA